MNENARNSGMIVINHKNTNQNIKNKVPNLKNRRRIMSKNPSLDHRIFYYLDKENNVIGYITLSVLDEKVLTDRDLRKIIGDKKVYTLFMRIFDSYKNKIEEYKSDFLQKVLDEIINKEDKFIFVDDRSIENTVQFYCSPEVLKNFNVYILLNFKEGQYIIGRKNNPQYNPQYIKINNTELKKILLNKTETNSTYAKDHINRYLAQYPENRSPNFSP